jgi:signal transduction histidine kinase
MAGAAGQPFDNIVAEATERLSRLWDSHHLGFLFPDESGDLRVHPSYKGLSSEVKESLRLSSGQGLTGWVFQTGKPVVTPDVRQSPRYFKTEASTLSEMDAPLVVGDRVIGVVNVESTRINAFSDDDLHLLSALAGQLAVILDNAQARRDLADWAQQLQDAYHELAQAEQLKDQLVQNISHELRTPLTYIRGFTELMLAEAFGSLPKELREPIEMINRKTETVTHLIERIVALQAMNPLELSPEPLEITDLIDETVEHWKLLAQKANIEITSDVPGDLPLVAGDRRQLGEALDNLLNNAVKFNVKGGKVMLRARGEAELVHIEISDTGIGIPFDKLSRVFDRFYQVDGTTRRRFGGAGVGLTLARQMVEAHGGHVWAESPGVGKGSTFHLILPTAPVGGR